MSIRKFEGEYRFLSNFWPAPITDYEGILWPTVEHAYQGAKTLNKREKEGIRNAKTPGYAKRLGKIVTMRPDFNVRRITIMSELVLLKFTQHVSLREKLIATEPQILIEGNWWHDSFWGSCMCQDCNIGENHLGKILMNIRTQLENMG